MRRAGIYCRISDDREGAGLGVTCQEADCRDRAGGLGWIVADLYVDNEISAYSGRSRPAYRRMLGDLRSDVIDAVAVRCWKFGAGQAGQVVYLILEEQHEVHLLLAQ